MRNNKRWLVLLLTVVMLVNTLGVSAMAVENESPLALYVSPAAELGSEVQVQIIASQAQIFADGKLVVTYDADTLTYVGTASGAAWADASAVTLSVNPAEGKVILAFASADAASVGTLFALTFQPKTAGEAVIAIDGSSYITGVDTDLACSDSVVVAEDCVDVTLNAGAYGTFADGSSETVIQVLPGSVLTAADLAPVVADNRWILSGWMTADGTVITPDALTLTVSAPLTLTAQYTFTCSGGDTCPSAAFQDISTLSPEAHAAVDFMVANGYMNGMSGTAFGPKTELTRGMMVTILYRIAGSPDPECECRYTDVPENRYFYRAVLWADATNITDGISENLFAPNKPLTRQELVTFLYRFAEFSGKDVTAAADLSDYDDDDTISKFAADAFRWAVAEGVIKGTTDTTLEPRAATTRVQVCLMVYRLLSSWD